VEEEEIVALTSEQQALFDSGKDLYAVTCGACHQLHGNGMDGLAPPLAGSEWTTGSVAKLVRIVQNGLSGPIQVMGKDYKMDMPGLPVFDENQIASILTYIRREWGHGASPVDPAQVAKIKEEIKDRQDMWSAKELELIP
jgi:mono/diheme cytochrome c family protein